MAAGLDVGELSREVAAVRGGGVDLAREQARVPGLFVVEDLLEGVDEGLVQLAGGDAAGFDLGERRKILVGERRPERSEPGGLGGGLGEYAGSGGHGQQGSRFGVTRGTFER